MADDPTTEQTTESRDGVEQATSTADRSNVLGRINHMRMPMSVRLRQRWYKARIGNTAQT